VHPQGGLKNIPTAAQRLLLLNQAEEADRRQAAESMVDNLLAYYSSVIIAALEEPGEPVYAAYEPVAGIILAAGEGHRFNNGLVPSKLLLEWMGEFLVHRAARLALEAGLRPVRVVLGAYAAELAQVLQDLPVEIIHNQDWAAGQSTSLKAGLEGLPIATGATIFLLGDQPFVTRELLAALRREHARSLPPLVAPWCGGRRANPALFDRRTFTDLLALSGDTGGRALFNMPERYQPAWLQWSDERLLLDIDTPEDYQDLKGKGEP
jgi:molybdenum cofactor cytidylyltransferase